MKKLIDVNYLQSPELAEYLSASPQNFVVMTDRLAMELYRPGVVEMLCRSLNILSQYPSQVIVLRPTDDIICEELPLEGLQKALINEQQTAGFSDFCRLTQEARDGNKNIQQEIEQMGASASTFLNDLTTKQDKVINAMSELISSYPEADLRAIRTKADVADGFIDRILEDIQALGVSMFHIGRNRTPMPPNLETAKRQYVFRFALASYVLVLKWAECGGPDGAKPETIRNDCIDMGYVAYATYFDGLLTNDEKAKELYGLAMMFLKAYDE